MAMPAIAKPTPVKKDRQARMTLWLRVIFLNLHIV